MTVGRIIGGRYRLEECLGRGGQGEVWRGTDLQLGEREVALKRAPQGEPDAIARIQREAETLAQVSHPHVVTIHDVAVNRGPDSMDAEFEERWIVMELLRGKSLRALSPVSVETAARYGAQLAGGLQPIHEAGLLHRDVTPGNVIVTDGGIAKLIDFGITRSLHDLETLSGNARLIGTPGFIAPEVAEANDLSEAADVFGLGATLYYAIHGTGPYGDGDAHELLNKTRTQMVNPPTRAGELSSLLTRMLSVSPRGRPSLDRVRAELADHAGEPEAGRGGSAGPAELGAHRPERHRVVGGAVSEEHLVREGSVRSRLFVGAGVTVAVAAVVALGATLWPDGVAPAGDSAVQASGEPGAIGHEASADPCALLNAGVFKRFGNANLDTDQGVLNGCRVEIEESIGAEAVLNLEIRRGKNWLTGRTKDYGAIEVVGHVEGRPQRCERELLVPDDKYYISLGAVAEQGPARTCEIADAAVDYVTGQLNEGEIPRRVPMPSEDSVQRLHACDLAPEPAVTAALGGEAADPSEGGFGGWDCVWRAYVGTSEDVREVRVVFLRDRPPSSEDGMRIELPGHAAYVSNDSFCDVDIVKAEHQDADAPGETTAELVHVEVSGSGPAGDECERTTALAGVIAGKLS